MKIKIPLKSLEDHSEDGKSVAPSVGDEVELPEVVAAIVGLDGDNAEVEIKSIAGTACCHDEPAKADPDEAEATEESVMKRAREEDGE